MKRKCIRRLNPVYSSLFWFRALELVALRVTTTELCFPPRAKKHSRVVRYCHTISEQGYLPLCSTMSEVHRDGFEWVGNKQGYVGSA